MAREVCADTLQILLSLRSRIVRRRSPLALFLAALAMFLGLTAETVRGQSQDPLQTLGIPPLSPQIPVEGGYISAGTGDLHLDIPLGSFPQRGGPPRTVKITYDSNIWMEPPGLAWGWQMPSGSIGVGWTFVPSADAGYVNSDWIPQNYCNLDGVEEIDKYVNFTLTTTDQVVHSFPIIVIHGNVTQCGDFTGSSQGNGAAYALDASGYQMKISNFLTTVYAPDGTQVAGYLSNGAHAPEDTNGNYLIQPNALSVNTVDTLGRTPVTLTKNGNTWTYTVMNSQGPPRTYTVTRELVYVNTNFPPAPNGIPINYSGSFNVVKSIQLPDGTSYSFTYDCGTTLGNYGQMTSMTLPTGGVISYLYANFLDSEITVPASSGPHVTRMISTRTTPDGVWRYTPAVIQQCTSYDPVQTCQQSFTVTNPGPTSDQTVYKFKINGGIWPFEVDYYSGGVSSANLLTTLTQSYDLSNLCPNLNFACGNQQAINVTKLSDTTTLPLLGGTSVSSTTKYTWDTSHYGLLIQKSEWNFGSALTGPADRTTCTGYQGGTAYLNANLLNLPTTVTIVDNWSSTPCNAPPIAHIVSQTVNSYDDWTLGGAPAAVNHDTNYGATYTVRGNLTQTKRWLNATGGWLVTKNYYDILGNLLQTTDPNLNSTYFDYTDSYYSVSPSPPTAAYVTKITKPITSGINHIERFQYYFGSGRPSAKCGENFPIGSACTSGLPVPQSDYVSYSYDGTDRPLTTSAGDGGQTSWTYGTLPSSATSTTKIDSSKNSVSTTILDGLGRTSQRQTSSGQGTIYTDFTYDSNGRPHTVSNPHFSTSLTTDGITTYSSYDGLERVLVLTEQDGSRVSTVYAGNCKTVTDEASKARKMCYDGFGRMTGVWEDPGSSPHLNYETDYQYDLLDNLLSVTQSGSRQRNFFYDSLSRLTQATNPESGTINYTYDANGNVKTRIDARSITTTYSYDALNRLTGKTYSDATPTAQFLYDSVALWGKQLYNTTGRMTLEQTVSSTGVVLSSSVFSYDNMGRLTRHLSCSPHACGVGGFDVNGAYDMIGELASFTHPVGPLVSWNYDSAGRMTQGTSSWIDSLHPGTLVTVNSYYPAGEIQKMTLGNGLIESMVYGPRLQACRHTLYSSGTPPAGCSDSTPSGNIQDFGYVFGNSGPTNNGNITTWTGIGTQGFSRTYGYDNVNRVSSLSDASLNPCRGLSWSYDNWGNRTAQTVTSGICGPSSLSFNSSNRITNNGLQYDAAGNLTNDGMHTYTYDAENNLTAVDGGTTASYSYDPLGHRSEKVVGGAVTMYAYDLEWNLACEWNWNSNVAQMGYLYMKGQLLAEYTPGWWLTPNTSNTYFVYHDHLGSARLVTNVTGGIVDSIDYLPFGEQIAGAPAGYTYCANEGQTCTFSGTMTVAYGAYGTFYFKTGVTGSIACNDATFGDPLVYIVKACYISTGGTTTTHRFTDKERDSESGLDNFGARYYSSQFGRFMTPDWSGHPEAVPYADLGNPQSLNLYSYVKNNPVSLTDPSGHCDWCQEMKNWLYYGHWVTNANLNAALASDAAKALKAMHDQGVSIRGENSDAALKGKSNQDIVDTYNRYLSAKSNNNVLVIGAMLGANGAQFTSKTLWESGQAHIDVENPNPGQRPGQIHYQDGTGEKYIFNVETGEFEGMSQTQSRNLLSQPEVQDAIQKGLKYLGVVK